MKTVIGAYPTAFTVEDAREYFKYKKETGHVDRGYEESIRSNFDTDENYKAFVNKLMEDKK